MSLFYEAFSALENTGGKRLCGRVAGIEYNERNEGIYRCKHRGQGCGQPGRSAKGLLRATVLALRVVRTLRGTDHGHESEPVSAGPGLSKTAGHGQTRKDPVDTFQFEKFESELDGVVQTVYVAQSHAMVNRKHQNTSVGAEHTGHFVCTLLVVLNLAP
jgi:hypothetical protein